MVIFLMFNLGLVNFIYKAVTLFYFTVTIFREEREYEVKQKSAQIFEQTFSSATNSWNELAGFKQEGSPKQESKSLIKIFNRHLTKQSIHGENFRCIQCSFLEFIHES